ncbi:MAG: bifunctional diaminohydroxyphosphoribosylaminopyrimidine deaminase/5-amino-6-(5-phosphoribosylamino)uracil reductase RibD, partial [Campylobacterota bacterium]|nr:bifunctional diaminohydroxyphosphoribosylaminopyrimidine deaminase/5-amino-6-(5-phosphoribosylamino)uracil reductase RibD [Campylobacterota bacterium]
MNKKSDFMQLAIDSAWRYQFLTYPNPAVGATVVKDNKVLAVGCHKKAGMPHAEVEALKLAYLTKYPNSQLKDLTNSSDIHNFLIQNHNDFFIDCSIYVTLEPCNHTGKTPACASLLEYISIKKVYISTLDTNNIATGGYQRLKDIGIDVEVGLLENQGKELLYPFTQWQKSNFSFFKIAMREDGSVNGGYITTKDSLTLVHKIREKLDLLVIGGETVRVDRPTLDARFSDTNISPNILIYSKQKDFDKTIPLFNIKNREVVICDNLDLISKNRFIMIEGGLNLLKTIGNLPNMIMLFISHKTKKDKLFDIIKLPYKKVHSYFINEFDEIIFL